jgi:hypothetical protein
MESQEQCDRMKQFCIDNNLPIWCIKEAFDFTEYDIYFSYHKDLQMYGVWSDFSSEEEQVTEKEFKKQIKKWKLTK